MHVHNAVYKAKESFSDISIHYVNEQYDDGAIIFQEKVELTPTDTPDLIAQKIQALEYTHYPLIIRRLLT